MRTDKCLLRRLLSRRGSPGPTVCVDRVGDDGHSGYYGRGSGPVSCRRRRCPGGWEWGSRGPPSPFQEELTSSHSYQKSCPETPDTRVRGTKAGTQEGGEGRGRPNNRGVVRCGPDHGDTGFMVRVQSPVRSSRVLSGFPTRGPTPRLRTFILVAWDRPTPVGGVRTRPTSPSSDRTGPGQDGPRPPIPR